MKTAIQDFIEGVNAIVRPLTTLLLVVGLLWGFFYTKIGAEAFLGLVSMVLGFWFRERQEKADLKAEVKGEVAAVVEEKKREISQAEERSET